MRAVLSLLSVVRFSLCFDCTACASVCPFLPASEPPVIVDLRSRSAFERLHLAGSASVPVQELETRMFELPPPREWPMEVVGSAEDLVAARRLLHSRGWKYAEHDADDPGFWVNQPTASGPSNVVSWRPNAFLAAIVRELDLSAMPSGTYVDVGCGSGRDAVYLAQALQRAGVEGSHPVLAIDNHGAALQRTRALAEACGVDVQCLEIDLRKPPGLEGALRQSHRPIALLHGCRFLHRPLFDASLELLAPGGLVVYSHFMDPLEGPPLAQPFPTIG